jgi:hypothetical protein
MLTMLALALQTPTLEADNAKAAMTCARAVSIADSPTKSPLQLTSQFTHLAMQSAKAKPGTGSFFDQLNTLSEQAGKAGALTPEQAKALAPLCDRRFPIARSSAPARLPADPFRRDLLCFGTLSVLQGAAEEIAKNGSDSDLVKIRAALSPLTGRMTDAELKKRGFGADDAFVKALGDEMLGSLASGNPMTIAAACGVALS